MNWKEEMNREVARGGRERERKRTKKEEGRA